MRNSGWIFMFLSVGFVVGLVTWCFRKVLTKPASTDHMHAPLDIDTHDLDT